MWTNYQQFLANKLNDLVAGEPIENDAVHTLIMKFARDPENASVFNYASMLHNHHFFFRNLSTDPQSLDKNPELKASLEKEFGSIETLRVTFLDTAAAMFGPGFVWLVWAREPRTHGGRREGAWRILTTYNAGTPYPEAGFRQQGVDMNNQNKDSFGQYLQNGQLLQPTNSAGSFGAHSQSGREMAKMPPGGTTVMPVLCVSTWEHAYMYDFGLQAKRQYLDAWWNAVDWGSVTPLVPDGVLGSGPKFSGPKEQWSQR
jgi:Fe-Mn family superoxide dismutase